MLTGGGGEKGIVNYYCYYDGQYLQAQYASADMKQRSPTSTAEKGFMFGSGNVTSLIIDQLMTSLTCQASLWWKPA